MKKRSFDKSIFITGANRGMGLGYVKHYLKKGFPVIATAKNLAKAPELLLLQKKLPNKLGLLKLDVTKESAIEKLVSELNSKKATITLVLNNAGISMSEEFDQWTMASFENHFRVNTIGPALISQAITPFMLEGAKLIQISSGMGSLAWKVNPENGLDAYAASKCALHSITVRLAEKLKSKKIGVFAINPGWVQTDMGGQEAPSTVDEAIADMTKTIEKLTIEQTGSFISEKGEAIPW